MRTSLVGVRFAKLMVLEVAGRTAWNELLWRCRCDCGEESVVRGKSLRAGLTRSCGCLINGPGHGVTHGGKGTRLYRIWRGMITRCENQRAKDYQRYGGAGIRVCREWRSEFPVFREWALGAGYEDSLVIDRRDGRKGYEPSNCRWVTLTESARNTSNTKLSHEKAEEIRRMVADGTTHSNTASAFGVSRANVSLICEGKLWVTP